MPSPETASETLAITLFGPMQVRVQGLLLPPLRSRKALWVLALLTLRHDRPVQREWLAATLWPDLDQSQAFANLRPVLSELRRALGEQGARLHSPDRQTLLLELADAAVDVLRFDAAITSGSLADLERAVGLYGGSLLEGCNEEWVPQERAVREQNCLQALQKLGEAALIAGNYEAAVGYYQRAASLDPWLDSARRGWMEALVKSGDRNAAMQVYREFLNVLSSDPTAVPDEQTTAFYRRLRAEARQQVSAPVVVTAEVAAIPRVTGYLPHSLTDLVGREDERIEIAARLRQSRLVTLTGFGGIGKTRLAIAVASESVREYADGVWLVALEALSEGRLVAAQIASVLGLREEPGRTALQSVTEYLRTKRLLLVLDNCEHLLEASAHIIAHLLRECAGVRILATSREALGIPGERVWAVPSLAVPDPAHLPQGPTTLLRVLMGYESVQLFVERAQAVQKTFALTSGNAQAVAQVCSYLEGIPLAIELASARVKAMTVEQIAARLDNELGLLTGGSRTSMSRQQTLRATLDWSYALLREPERQLLRRLSVFVGGWRLEAAEAVCAGEGIASSRVLDLLLSLVDKSLVVFGAEQDGDGRYHLLEMVRQYATESLQASGEADQVKTRHQEWCLNFAELAEQSLKTGEQAVWLSRLESEHGNLRVALDRGRPAEQALEARLRLAGALRWFWNVRGFYSEGREYLNRVLQEEGAQSRTAARAKALFGAGILAYSQSDYVVARSLYQESLGICKELNDSLGTAEILSKLGQLVGEMGDYIAARPLYEESLSIHRALGNKRGIADLIDFLGSIAYIESDYNSARSLYEESLSIRREAGYKQGIADSLVNLGLVAANQSDYVLACSLHQESLSIRREEGYRQGITDSLNHLGNVAFMRGDDVLARSLYEESLSIRRELGDRRGTAESLMNLGNVAVRQGEYATSRVFFEESLSIQRELGHRRGVAFTLCNMGELAREQGDYASAWSLYEESLSLWREFGDQFGIAWALMGLGNLSCDRNDYSVAQTLLKESLQLFRDLSNLQGVAESLRVMATVMLAQSEPQLAVCLWGAAHMLRESIGVPLHSADQQKYDQQVAQARSALGQDAFAAAWEEGSALNWEQAVLFALAEEASQRFDENAE
jgi:predicted ATPase/DNA-binding SARP family transcriptional activator